MLVASFPPFLPPLAFLDEALGPVLLLLIWVVRAIFTATSEAKQRRALDSGEAVGEPPEEDDAVRSELEEFLARMRDGGERDEPDGDRANGDGADDASGAQRARGDRAAMEQGAGSEPVREARMAPKGLPTGRVIEVFDDEPERPVLRRPEDPFLEPQRRVRPTERVESASPGPIARPPASRPQVRSSAAAAPANELMSDASAEPTTEMPHLPESQLAEHAAHLGERIAGADDRVRARLSAKFGKSVSEQDADEKALLATPPEDTSAARIAAALSSANGVRDAMVLNEILQRPTDRW
ncbi:MAG: hypothetical protein AAFV43_05625 [Planctomycetota bacterium]